MSKGFREVFPTLKLNNDLELIFMDAEVLKISSTVKRDRLRIYLKIPHLVEKNHIYALEREIASMDAYLPAISSVPSTKTA